MGSFAAALRSHCRQHEVAATLETEYGIQYVIIGSIETPDGRNPRIRAVWQVDNGANYPRFITARPGPLGGSMFNELDCVTLDRPHSPGKDLGYSQRQSPA